MSTTIIIGSNNENKIAEIQQILPKKQFKSLKDYRVEDEAEENGQSFFENAKIKASFYYKKLQEQGISSFAVLAEDSGICIDALDGRPGIYSARYAEDTASEETKKQSPQWQLQHVLTEMRGKTNRTARFICTVVIYLSPDNFICSQASWEGEIVAGEAQGSYGFGYDPIFYLPELKKCSAMLEPSEKNRLSHRAQALQHLAPMLYAL